MNHAAGRFDKKKFMKTPDIFDAALTAIRKLQSCHPPASGNKTVSTREESAQQSTNNNRQGYETKG